MRAFLKSIIFLISLSFAIELQAQENNQSEYYKLPLKIAMGNHAVGFPYQNTFSSLHPNISIGSEFPLNKNHKHQLYLSSNIIFIDNNIIGNTIASDLNGAYRFVHSKGIFIENELGLGIVNQYHPRAIFELNSEDGSYSKIDDNGTLSSLIGIRSGIGYDLFRKYNLPIKIGINHYFFIQTSYFDVVSFPIMPQSTTNITIHYKFKK